MKATSDWKLWSNKFGFQNVHVKDCGANGNCQFLVVSEAIRPSSSLSAAQLRTVVGNEVLKSSDIDFNAILVVYREEVKRNEFSGAWNPLTCRTREQLKNAIESPNRTGNGSDFQGDAITLDLLSKALGIRIIVFYHRQRYSYTYEKPTHEQSRFTICVLYHAQPAFHHYQLLGVTTPTHTSPFRVETLFPTQTMSIEVRGVAPPRDPRAVSVKSVASAGACNSPIVTESLGGSGRSSFKPESHHSRHEHQSCSRHQQHQHSDRRPNLAVDVQIPNQIPPQVATQRPSLLNRSFHTGHLTHHWQDLCTNWHYI